MADLKRNTDVLARAQLASPLMAARPQGHIYRLQSVRFGEHIALDEFYKGIGKKQADRIIEAMQGQFGMIRGYKFEPMREDDIPIAYLKELRQKIAAIRYEAIPEREHRSAVAAIDEAVIPHRRSNL